MTETTHFRKQEYTIKVQYQETNKETEVTSHKVQIVSPCQGCNSSKQVNYWTTKNTTAYFYLLFLVSERVTLPITITTNATMMTLMVNIFYKFALNKIVQNVTDG